MQKKVSKAVKRRGDRAAHPTRRKPETGSHTAEKEITDYFASDYLKGLQHKELLDGNMAVFRGYGHM